MGLTQSKLAVGDLIFDARLCGPEGGAVVALLHGWPEFSSWPAWLFPWCQTARRG